MLMVLVRTCEYSSVQGGRSSSTSTCVCTIAFINSLHKYIACMKHVSVPVPFFVCASSSNDHILLQFGFCSFAFHSNENAFFFGSHHSKESDFAAKKGSAHCLFRIHTTQYANKSENDIATILGASHTKNEHFMGFECFFARISFIILLCFRQTYTPLLPSPMAFTVIGHIII